MGMTDRNRAQGKLEPDYPGRLALGRSGGGCYFGPSLASRKLAREQWILPLSAAFSTRAQSFRDILKGSAAFPWAPLEYSRTSELVKVVILIVGSWDSLIPIPVDFLGTLQDNC